MPGWLSTAQPNPALVTPINVHLNKIYSMHYVKKPDTTIISSRYVSIEKKCNVPIDIIKFMYYQNINNDISTQ